MQLTPSDGCPATQAAACSSKRSTTVCHGALQRMPVQWQHAHESSCLRCAGASHLAQDSVALQATLACLTCKQALHVPMLAAGSRLEPDASVRAFAGSLHLAEDGGELLALLLASQVRAQFPLAHLHTEREHTLTVYWFSSAMRTSEDFAKTAETKLISRRLMSSCSWLLAGRQEARPRQ